MEVETQLAIAKVLGYLNQALETELLAKTNELGRIINGLILSLNES